MVIYLTLEIGYWSLKCSNINMKVLHKRAKEILEADFDKNKVILNLETYIAYTLNQPASLIWDFLRQPKDINEIAQFLKDKYNISAGRAKKDAQNFVRNLKERGLLWARKPD